jgi:4'-phosphopantetheinyl transferase
MVAALNSHTVRVRWLSVDAEDMLHLIRWRRMLDAEELIRADRYHFAADRNIYIAAHALARFMLTEATGLPITTWRFVAGKFGKPALTSEFSTLNLHFNISHTRGLAACAIANRQIGVDVERFDAGINLNLAQNYFAPEEIQILDITPSSQRVQTFFRLWSLKEAYIKATGDGLSRPLNSFSFSLDPIGITFHPDRQGRPCHDDPVDWRFWEFPSINDCAAALGMQLVTADAIQLDVGPAQPRDIG